MEWERRREANAGLLTITEAVCTINPPLWIRVIKKAACFSILSKKAWNIHHGGCSIINKLTYPGNHLWWERRERENTYLASSLPMYFFVVSITVIIRTSALMYWTEAFTTLAIYFCHLAFMSKPEIPWNSSIACR